MEASNTSVTFFARGGDGVKVLTADPMLYEEASVVQESEKVCGALSQVDVKSKVASWSPDGMQLAVADPNQGVVVVDLGDGAEGAEAGNKLFVVNGSSKTTQSLTWSPMSTTLVSTNQVVKGCADPQIQVWRRSSKDGCESGGGTGEWLQAASFQFPKLERDKKVFHWSSDETYCARLCPDGMVMVHDGADLAGTPLLEMKFDHSAENFEFAPLLRARAPLKARLAVFVPDVRDDMQRVVAPGELTVWEIHDSGGGDGLKLQKKATVFVAAGQNSELKWNFSGTAILANCTTEVDESGKSYYGGSKLMLSSADGSYTKDLTEDADTNPGGHGWQPQVSSPGMTVQAVDWSPTRDEFILIQGFQPAKVMLWSWDEKGKKATLVKVLAEKVHRNTIRFNPFGSLVCLAGFGNLAGDVDFLGRPDDEKCDFVRVASVQAACTVSSEWAPDGRHLLTAVLAPRMRVDNGFSMWKALTGSKVIENPIEELFEMQWRPEPSTSLRFLDISPEEVERAVKALAERDAGEGGQKKQAYRPPKARMTEGGNSVSAMMRGEAAVPMADDRRGRRPWQQPTRKDSGYDGEDKPMSPGRTEPPSSAPPPQDGASGDGSAEGWTPNRAGPPTAPPSSPPPAEQVPPKHGMPPASPKMTSTEKAAARTPPSQRPPPPPAPPPPGPAPATAPQSSPKSVPQASPKHAPKSAPPKAAPPTEAPQAPPPKNVPATSFPAGPPPSQPPQPQQAKPAAPPPSQPAPRRQQQQEQQQQRQQQQQQQQQQAEANAQGYPGQPAGRHGGPPTHAPPPQQNAMQQASTDAAQAALAAYAQQQQQQYQAQSGFGAYGKAGEPTPQQMHALRQQAQQADERARLQQAAEERARLAGGFGGPRGQLTHDPAAADSAVIAAYSQHHAHHQDKQNMMAQMMAQQAEQAQRYIQQQAQAQQAQRQQDLARQQRAAAQQAQQQAQQQQQQQQQQQAAQAAAAAQQQARQQQQQESQADKRSCPANGWQYVDPKGAIQGPFTLMEMQLWNSMGYFRPDLPMRCFPNDDWIEFNKLFPSPLVPFESYPRRVNNGGNAKAGMHGR